ncbi:hypothetical protein [Engelhardtia mirabilis]|uniref:Uncharacterized protein n=1 Tax=Engelhardtia mirabilis TaxID=2528011 RepID=A0A518BQE4_9BACT|nr:hypothetical protein Pla133_42970 [Planctomycetes bacterium Pla133]QDV03507.1 hypothetical protein Pla86_42960 [Planctomycetes bacterium Pla86]
MHYRLFPIGLAPIATVSIIASSLGAGSIAGAATTPTVQGHQIALDVISNTTAPRPGIPVQVQGYAAGVAKAYNLVTDGDGFTPFVEVGPLSTMWITLGEASLAGTASGGGGSGGASGGGSSGSSGGGQAVGVTRPWLTADSSVAENDVFELLTVTQPTAHTHHFAPLGDAPGRFGPGDEEIDWQEVVVLPPPPQPAGAPASEGLSFRGHSGSLATMHDIHGVLNYQGYGDAPFHYDAGFYLDSPSVNIPDGELFVAFNYMDRDCPRDTVVDLYEFRTAGPLPATPVKAEIEAVSTLPPGVLVRVRGTKSAGKLILCLRSGSFGPPIVHRGVSAPPTLSPLTDPGQFGHGGGQATSADAGFDCGACTPYNGESFVHNNTLTCDPETPLTGDCPPGELLNVSCKGRTKPFGPIVCPKAGAVDSSVKGEIVKGFSISGTFNSSPGGVGVDFGIDWEQSSSTLITEGIPNPPEGECAECVQLNAIASWCRGIFKFQVSQWELLPYPHVDPCSAFDRAVVACGPNVVVKGASCDQSKFGGSGD